MSDETDELREQIVEDATDGIASVSVDGMTVTQMSPAQRLAVLRELDRRDQSNSTTLPLRLTPIRVKGLQ